MYEDDFLREILGDTVVEKVNLERATIKEAKMFKERMLFLANANFKTIIVDFSMCNYVDSSIIGVMILTLKQLKGKNIELRIVVPGNSEVKTFRVSGLQNVFNLFISVQDAIDNTEKL